MDTFKIKSKQKICNKVFREDVEIQFDFQEGEFQIPVSMDELLFHKCIFLKKTRIRFLNDNHPIGQVSLFFNYCIIKELSTDVFDSKNERDASFNIHFNKCIIGKSFLNHTKLTYIEISTSIIKKEFRINQSDVATIEIDKVKGNVFIQNCQKSNVTVCNTMKNSKILKQLKSIYNYNYLDSNLHIQNAGSLNMFDFSKSMQKPIYKQNNLFIILSNDFKSYISINDFNFNYIEINGKSNSQISLNHCKTNDIYIDTYSSLKTEFYEFECYSEKGVFIVHNSDLTNVSFTKVDFNSFNKVSFYRTTIEKSSFSSTIFPKKIYAFPYEEDLSDVNEEYENYLQLKLATNQRGNQAQTLAFHKNMYDALYRSKSNKCWLTNSDKFILTLNKVSNNFGTSISNAFLLIVVLNFTLSFTFILTLEAPYYKAAWLYLPQFLTTLDYYSSTEIFKIIFELINPVHRIQSIRETLPSTFDISWLSYAVSFLARIINAWLFYQFVAAFRKFGKKL